jgi:hypothetical protein
MQLLRSSLYTCVDLLPDSYYLYILALLDTHTEG